MVEDILYISSPISPRRQARFALHEKVLLALDSVVIRAYLGEARHGGRACSGSRYSSLLDGGRLPARLFAEGEALGGEAQVGNTAGHHLLQRVEEAHRGSLLRSSACSETSKRVQTKIA